MIRTKSYFRNLCVKYLNHNIRDDEKKIFSELLEKSDKHRKTFIEIRNIWTTLEPEKIIFDLQIDKEWEELENTMINNPMNSESTFANNKNLLLRPILKPAIILLFFVLVSTTVTLLIYTYEKKPVHKTVATLKGEQKNINLPDGSFLRLNCESEISYFEPFNENQRNVNFKGEGFFNIKKDARPFIIHTENAATTVLGTKFNVWARENETRVVVKEGKVKFAELNDTSKSVLLNRGEMSRIIESKPPIKDTVLSSYYSISWLENKLVFDRTPLHEIFRELERSFDKKIVVNDTKLNTLTLTGVFSKDNPDSIISKICLALNLSFSVDIDGYIISDDIYKN